MVAYVGSWLNLELLMNVQSKYADNMNCMNELIQHNKFTL